ncbi:MAG: putative RDD family membrane protein YckC [Glaciecola sp.]|jgi:uncharacterized RDD family membrane protein YckC
MTGWLLKCDLPDSVSQVSYAPLDKGTIVSDSTTTPSTPTMPAPPAAQNDGPAFPQGVVPTAPFKRLGAALLDQLLATVTLGIGWIIWAAMLAPNGQTPAKKLLGMRVIDATTMQPAGMSKMLLMRGVVGGLVASFALSITLGVLAFMPFWDRKNQNVWDKVSATYVVDDALNFWKR